MPSTDITMVAICGVCRHAVEQELIGCSSCAKKYHSVCWSYNGGCATYACGQTPEQKKGTFPVPVGDDNLPAQVTDKPSLLEVLGGLSRGEIADVLGLDPKDAQGHSGIVDAVESYAKLRIVSPFMARRPAYQRDSLEVELDQAALRFYKVAIANPQFDFLSTWVQREFEKRMERVRNAKMIPSLFGVFSGVGASFSSGGIIAGIICGFSLYGLAKSYYNKAIQAGREGVKIQISSAYLEAILLSSPKKEEAVKLISP